MDSQTVPSFVGSGYYGNGGAGNITDATGNYLGGWWPVTQPLIVQPSWPAWPVEPIDCIGKAHVFECDHVKKCKCGKITRVLQRQKGQR